MLPTILNQTLAALITANHILHYNHLADAFGHISVRNPLTNNTFFMSNFIAAALVSSPNDIAEYHIEDASPVDPSTGPGFGEKFIHSEILKKFPGVQSVVHSHSVDVLSYAVLGNGEGNGKGSSEVELLGPVYHMAGFLGNALPFSVSSSVLSHAHP